MSTQPLGQWCVAATRSNTDGSEWKMEGQQKKKNGSPFLTNNALNQFVWYTDNR